MSRSKSQQSLFDEDPAYCIDTNVIRSFLSESPDEHYGSDVFKPQWRVIEEQIESGRIVTPPGVFEELKKWAANNRRLDAWLTTHKAMICERTTQHLVAAKTIVNRFKTYGLNANYAVDLELIALGLADGLTVFTSERSSPEAIERRPKIPDVCGHFDVGCVNVPLFLRQEMVVSGLDE